MCAGIRWFSIDQLHCRDAQRPYVCLEIIPSLLDDLGGHPKRGANEGIPLRLDVRKLSGDPKVCQFDFPVLREEDIRSLDISVNLPFLMQIVEAE